MAPIAIEDLMKDLVAGDGALHIFGYASIIWKPNFPFKQRTVGYITGYERKFYQGTTTHRGTPEWPGRVATLVPSASGIVWGVSYEVRGVEDIKAALEHLAEREMILGGYRFDCVDFFPYVGRRQKPEPYRVQVYIAEPGNDQYLGEAPIDLLAYQIAKAKGFCGRNIEYVKKVAVFMLEEVPNGQDKDPHVFELVRRTEAFIYEEDELQEADRRRLPMRVALPHEDCQINEAADGCVLGKDKMYSDEYLRHVTL